MSDALKKSIVDAIEEGQLKLGYREETIRLYYPLSSLCTLMHQSMDAAQMTRALTTFSEQVKGELGEIEVSRKGERFCLAVGPKGAAWVHEHTDSSGFWRISSRQSAATAAPWTSCWRSSAGTAGMCMWRRCTTANLTGWCTLRMESRMRIATASPTRAAT